MRRTTVRGGLVLAAGAAVALLGPAPASAATHVKHFGTLYNGNLADSYGTTGENADRAHSYVKAWLRDDKADGNGAYEKDVWSKWDHVYDQWKEYYGHNTARIGTRDGRVKKYYHIPLPSGGRVYIKTKVCTDISLRPDPCSGYAGNSFSF